MTTKKLFPTYRVDSVLEITPSRLADWRIASLLLDVDCTLKRYSENELAPETFHWLETLQNAGIFLVLLSNGKKGRIGRFAEKYRLPFIAQAMKPLPNGCRRAVRQFRLDPASTAIVGDQIFADILAGNLAGLTTILVTPIHPEEEPWFTRLKRPLEKRILRALPDPVKTPKEAQRSPDGSSDND